MDEAITGLNNLGIGLFRLKKFTEAKFCFEKILTLEPKNEDAAEYIKLLQAGQDTNQGHKKGWSWWDIFGLAPARIVTPEYEITRKFYIK